MIGTRQGTALQASSIWKIRTRRRNLILPELDLDLDAVFVKLQASLICKREHADYSDLDKHQDKGDAPVRHGFLNRGQAVKQLLIALSFKITTAFCN